MQGQLPSQSGKSPQVIPSRESVLHGQLNLLMGAAVPLMQFIANTRDTVGETSIGPLDGGVKCSVEASLMGLFSRLDKLVADDANWTLVPYQIMESRYSDLMQAHTDALVAQRRTSETLVKPHMRMRPTLLKLDIGGWAAVCGELGSESLIIGHGSCPSEALDNFDLVFDGKLDNPVFMDVEQPTEKQNEETPMDSGGRLASSKPAKRRASRQPRRKIRGD
jgi:hypothetical protein